MYKIIGGFFSDPDYKSLVNPNAFSRLPEHALRGSLRQIGSARALDWLCWNEDVIFNMLKPVVQYQLETGYEIDWEAMWPGLYVGVDTSRADLFKLAKIAPYVPLHLKEPAEFQPGDFPLGTKLHHFQYSGADPRFLNLYQIIHIGSSQDILEDLLSSACLEELSADSRAWTHESFVKLAKALKEGTPKNLKIISLSDYQKNETFENSMLEIRDSWFKLVRRNYIRFYKNY